MVLVAKVLYILSSCATCVRNEAHLDCLIVDQRIDGDRGRLVVGFVRRLTKLRAVGCMSAAAMQDRQLSYRQAVVLTVNQVYATIVTAVTSAYLKPKLYVYERL